ncbi:tetraketide alpha-pyrone reductase 2 [Brassica rapa]|uniref:tetraketide alpha-pyrone reductase 2 n=1 Tax=Brassica campestris TaxID=3711 RepID=UPI0006AB4B06|nr:tetraketide alpha-pyrone reductase 2 [Brassica rapa]
MASRRTRSNYSSPLRRDMTEEKDEKIVPNLPKSVEFLSMMTSIASHVVKALLDLGHSVRTTVRDSSDEEKVRFLWELKGAKERLKIFEADLTVEGSFDEAIKGVDGVFHIASRVTLCVDSNDLEKLVDRDINGTRNLMNSCEKSRNTVKRIVLTSSSTAVRYRYDATEASPLNESHYSDLDYSKSFKK